MSKIHHFRGRFQFYFNTVVKKRQNDASIIPGSNTETGYTYMNYLYLGHLIYPLKFMHVSVPISHNTTQHASHIQN